jgi:hypothetical protein
MGSSRIFGAVVAVSIVAGCSSHRAEVGDAAGAPVSLVELNDLLHIGAGNGRPATKLSDLDREKGKFPRGYEAAKNGDVVVLWAAKPKGEGEIEKGADQDIVAYEKNVPTEGGYVLFSGGTIKKMTPSEFNAAPKAGKR